MMVARVVDVEPVGRDTATYWLELCDAPARAAYGFRPGQFNMLYVWGLGEVPISVSSDPATPGRLAHTIRAVGSVTAAFPELTPGDEVGLRGPFGHPWPVDAARGGDAVVIAGGLGLAPLRSVIAVALRDRAAFRRVVVLVGARTPDDLIYRDELESWRRSGDAEVALTVDHGDASWPHSTGLVTALVGPAALDAERTTAFVCGPEIMMAAVADRLATMGVDAARVYVSLERNMQCAVRRCGHCQLGPSFVCADGPVYAYAEVAPWLHVAHL
jgi:NAD(P)H-flavin reductase